MATRTWLIGIVAFLVGLGVGILATRAAGQSRNAPFSSTGPITTGPFKNYADVAISTLQAKGMSGDCPMCRKNQWVVHEVPVSLPVYEMDGAVKYPGTSMPMAAMICRNCGFMSLHSLGALDLIPGAK